MELIEYALRDVVEQSHKTTYQIEEELKYLDDPQNQYDSAIFPKEDLVGYIQDILIKRGH